MKKQHEIVRLSASCALAAAATGCRNVVDAGAGVGHLARHLSHCHALRPVCLESERQFGQTADRLDAQLKLACLKHGLPRCAAVFFSLGQRTALVSTP